MQSRVCGSYNTAVNYKLHKLPNGVRLLVVPMPSLASATLTVWVQTGSRNESDRLAGISHFLEHMVFKGGQKRSTAKEIADSVDAIGGEFNAGTSKEWTNFYIKARAGNVDVAYDVLADMVLSPQLRQEDIDREKGVIIEEIGMYEDTPLWKIDDIFENLIYKGSTLGRDIIGSKETVSSFKREDFDEYRKAFYNPKNILVTVSGGVTEKEALRLTKKYFGDLKPSRSKIKSASNKYKTTQTKPQILLSSKKKDQTHFILGFRSSEMNSKSKYSESLLATILGGGMSSRLFTEIREVRGLAYSVRASRDAAVDTGYIGIYAGVDPKKAYEAVRVALSECYDLVSAKKPITEIELLKAKEYIKGHVALSLEDTKAINSFFGLKELLVGKIETPEKLFENIDKVTIKDVMKVARKILVPTGLNLAIIGNYKDASKFEEIIKN